MLETPPPVLSSLCAVEKRGSPGEIQTWHANTSVSVVLGCIAIHYSITSTAVLKEMKSSLNIKRQKFKSLSRLTVSFHWRFSIHWKPILTWLLRTYSHNRVIQFQFHCLWSRNLLGMMLPGDSGLSYKGKKLRVTVLSDGVESLNGIFWSGYLIEFKSMLKNEI